VTAAEWRTRLDAAPYLRDPLARVSTLDVAGGRWCSPYMAMLFQAVERLVESKRWPEFGTDRLQFVRSALAGMPAVDLRFDNGDWLSPATRDLFAAIERFVAEQSP
jgi:hypothetical protein